MEKEKETPSAPLDDDDPLTMALIAQLIQEDIQVYEAAARETRYRIPPYNLPYPIATAIGIPAASDSRLQPIAKENTTLRIPQNVQLNASLS